MPPSTHISNLVSGELTDSQISALCTYHDDPSKAQRYAAIREATEQLMRAIRDNCPRCAGRTTALQNALAVRMAANACIALEGVEA